MSRWRPASTERRSPYVTAEGLAALKAEYDQLWRVRRPDVVRHLAAAAAEGDRSENAEYQYRKKELREIDRRVRYLQTRLPVLKVPEAAPADLQKVFFGAWVRLSLDGEEPVTYRIVGPDETDAGAGRISVDSPLAIAVLRRRVGESVSVVLPAGEVDVEVVAVSYQGPFTNPSI
jgi:transcription elongation factor GreB